MTALGLIESMKWKYYWVLCKPNVIALMLLTSLIGMLLATPDFVPFSILMMGNIGIMLCAASAATVNHIIDRHIDQLMSRTAQRPIVKGHIALANAIAFALILGMMGFAILFFYINPLTAWLTLGALLGYAIFYTVFLKRMTPQNIVLGGLAGAIPPLLGWTAVTNRIDPHALLLVLIIFTWTPPHFWALAIHRKNDYQKANIPMLPVTHGEKYAALHILLYTILLYIVSILPWVFGMSGLIYLSIVMVLGCRFLYWSFKLWKKPKSSVSMNTFYFSIWYLMLLFLALLLDHYL
ncbi:MAG: protoheme IX farnesyltransferase [Endozoicomonadaceae bacterium]|nr:protoheme IX farnesyltransferase [Endozoicomonadaceae bacterium]